MKKVLGLFLLIGTMFVLSACSAGLDGKYYSVYGADDKLSTTADIEIEGKTLTYHYGNSDLIYSIDEDKKVMIGKSKTEPYDYKDGVFKFGGSEFVKEGSDRYNELKK